MDRTLWKNRESKWKPRNFQAARAMFPAKGLHLPPPPPTINMLEQREKEKAERKKRAEEAEKGIQLHKQQLEEQRRFQKQESLRVWQERQTRPPCYKWIGRYMRDLAKKMRRPPPTPQQVEEARKRYAETGRMPSV